MPPSADHHQVIGDDNPVPAAGCSDGAEGPFLPFRSALGSVAAVADEDARARLSRLCPEEEGTSRQPGRLDPAHGEDGRTDEAVTVVEVQRHRDVLPMVAEQVSGELGCCPWVIDPSWQVERCLWDSVRMCISAPARSEQGADAGKGSRDHRGALQ